jgi:hypothetical protein
LEDAHPRFGLQPEYVELQLPGPGFDTQVPVAQLLVVQAPAPLQASILPLWQHDPHSVATGG